MPNGLSRRSFLRGTAVSGVGMNVSGIASPAGAPTPRGTGAQQLGPAAVPLTLNVNGVVRSLHVEPRTTLAEVLRGPLDLTGTKIACNRGACSACTVWLDGVTVCACMMLAIEVGTRKVTTIEGLSHGDTLHPVQAAFIEHDAMQCGFCTPGMAMSCIALLEHTSHPSANEVKVAISGHLCRCGTYPHVVEATLAAAAAIANRKGKG
jgi:xanthine dehydrogenase YagT iron-sulfur-binding subunit